MRHFIARCTGWFRTFGFGTDAREGAAHAPDETLVEPPRPAPVQEPEPPSSSSCGVYVWATAHGIDLSYPGPLGSCTCSARPHPEPPFEPRAAGQSLRAKVREANAASRWGK
ncbi:hypothetical protein AB0L26_26325 [Streptomyces nondiastaticus]|uniref:hypothetical protein n=1 Tax=Streptomyces nondiastaticus TaxID=3154512 RepID=UPI003434EC18